MSDVVPSRRRTAWLVLAGTLFAIALHGMSPIGHLLWPPGEIPGIAPPTPVQVALLMGVALIEALAFGAGVAFVARGWRLVRERRLSRASFFAIAWLLLSWVPHDNLHMAGGPNIANLIAIEWVFHVTLVLSAVVLAWDVGRVRAASTSAATPARTKEEPLASP